MPGLSPELPGRTCPTAPLDNPDGRAVCVPTPARPTLRRAQRLRHDRQFREAYAKSAPLRGRHMVLFLRDAPDSSARLGVVASRKVGNAVERARAKRRLREVFRLNRHLLPPGFRPDIVLVARRSILSAPWPRLVADYAALVSRLQP